LGQRLMALLFFFFGKGIIVNGYEFMLKVVNTVRSFVVVALKSNRFWDDVKGLD